MEKINRNKLMVKILKKNRRYEIIIMWLVIFIIFFVANAKADTYEEVKWRITTTLSVIDIVYGGDPLYSHEMVSLLLLTLAVESDFCRNINSQSGNDLGSFQLNIENVEDIYKNFLKYKKQNKLLLKANHYKSDASLKYDLTNNFEYSVIIASIHYKRRLKEWMPITDWEMAHTWRLVYNCGDKSRAKTAYKKYYKYCKKGD